MIQGEPLNNALVEEIKQNILAQYREEGFLFATVTTKQEYNESNEVLLSFFIDENKPVKVRSIRFTGNENAKESRLQRVLPTKEKSSFFGIGGEFKEQSLETNLDTLELYYQTLGYLNAEVQDYRIEYAQNSRLVDLEIDILEGQRFYIGDVNIIHNDILSNQQVVSRFQLEKGDVADQSKIAISKFEMETLFRDFGYLFVRVREERVFRDSILDLTYYVEEGNLAYINKVHIRGNTKTRDKVVRRVTRIYPGDVFSQSKILRSHREITQLNYFDVVEPNYEPVNNSLVDVVFNVKEREKGTGTFSAGASFSQFDGLVGNLGLQIANLFGRGQRVEANLERGAVRQLYSFGFTEPWLFDTPTSVGGSIFWRALENVAFSNTTTTTGFNPTGNFAQRSFGATFNLGRRLTWPDDFFSIFGTYSFIVNRNGTQRDPRLLLLQSGLESSLQVNIVRDDKDLPVFATKGFSLFFTLWALWRFSWRRF